MGITVSVSGGKVSLRHDQREYKPGKAPENIDESRSYLNEYFVKCSTTVEQAFNGFFKNSLAEYNAKQTRPDRKKLNYYNELKQGKNKETLVYEYVIQLGNKDNVQGTPAENRAVEVLREYAESFQEQNPNFHIIAAAMHRDEATPHLHISFIPFAEGYKSGLNKRCSTSRALESMGYKGQERNMKSWKREQESRLESLMNKQGLQRESMGSTRPRVDIQLYKEIKDQALVAAEEELQLLNKQIKRKKDALANMPDPEDIREQVSEAHKTLLEVQRQTSTENDKLTLIRANLEELEHNTETIGRKYKMYMNGWTDSAGKRYLSMGQLEKYRGKLLGEIAEARHTVNELRGTIQETVTNIFLEVFKRIDMGKEIAFHNPGIAANGMQEIEQQGHLRSDEKLGKDIAAPVKGKITEIVDKAEKEITEAIPEYISRRRSR